MTHDTAWGTATPAFLVGTATVTVAADGPDIITSSLFDSVANYGSEDPSGTGDYISAFGFGINWCNVGTERFDMNGSTSQHAAVFESMFRLKDGRFEQIGLSWGLHEFYALNAAQCGLTCEAPPFPSGLFLYPGCSDPHTASIVGSRTYLGPSWELDAHTGYFPWPPTPASGSGPIANRLQVHDVDLDLALNGGAIYFVQAHSIQPQDASAGNGNNNASYRRIVIVPGTGGACAVGRYCAVMTGATQQMQPAIRAWKDTDPLVYETDAQVPGEGLFTLAAKVTDLGDGYWHYEYALQNLNSDRSGGSFTVPIPAGVSIRNVGFHDVDYHDGDGVACPGCVCAGGVNSGQACSRNSDCPFGSCNGSHINFDGTDWPVTIDRCRNTYSAITWTTTSYAVDPNANALRWSTLYNFRFDAHTEPNWDGYITVSLGLFNPSFPHQIQIPTIGPYQPLPPHLTGDSDCDGDVDLFDAGGFQACFSGAIDTPTFVAPSVGCLWRFDFDYDGDVDLADYKVFFWAYTRP